MTEAEWNRWYNDSLKYFEEHYATLKSDLADNGKITKKREVTSILYNFNRCNYEAAEKILSLLEEDAIQGNPLSLYLLGHVYMYNYKGMQIRRNLEIAREYFRKAHEINCNFTNKQNP